MKRILLAAALAASTLLPLQAQTYRPKTSVAGFYALEESGRTIYNFNLGWRYHRGEAPGAEAADFDDRGWELVATPHTVELLPADGSGCRNYQGVAWYRKHFTLPADLADRQVVLHFEAIMGKQAIYLNGKLVKEHKGGYMPVTIDLTAVGIRAGEPCVVAVMADNSNDKSYPPGKPQYTLDFAYHGGIYRDVWLIGKNRVAITDAIEAGKPAGGGVFVHYDRITPQRAEVHVDTDLHNSDTRTRSVTVETTLRDAAGRAVGTRSTRVTLRAGEGRSVSQQITVANPQLWEPDRPYLYAVESRVKEGKRTIDGGMTRAGIRKVEFRGHDGLYLNDKPFGQLIGTNRHQDFAYVGNALPNSQQWNDAKRLRDAGCRIIRTAHYPQDPSFMDACDELGLFIIVATPGWQYWNKDPQFGEAVHANTRDIIRRDRNHPSVILWEPILNETRFPKDFALRALQLTRDEYPYPGAPGAAADMHSAGVAENYDVVYGWPTDEGKGRQSIFTREFGEYVDDWYAHNNLNRVARSWGEGPMLVQALSLARTYGEMNRTTGQFVGGAQWHSFDHQRGYHPDTYWGGLFDCFRQPKYAYSMFKSQIDPKVRIDRVATGPMIFIAHEMSQFSPEDVTLFTNCDSVRLTIYGKKSWTKAPVRNAQADEPYGVLTFEKVWNFWEARDYSYTQKNWQAVKMVAEGYVDGQVACTAEKMPSRRSTKLRLRLDDTPHPLVADGSDFAVVIAEVTDDSGNVRRLAKEEVLFTVSGEGEIIGDASIGANPRVVEFGSAPVLIRATDRPGKIKVTARVRYEGTHAPTPAEIEFESVPSEFPFCQSERNNRGSAGTAVHSSGSAVRLDDAEKSRLLQEVERQQADFGIQQ